MGLLADKRLMVKNCGVIEVLMFLDIEIEDFIECLRKLIGCKFATIFNMEVLYYLSNKVH